MVRSWEGPLWEVPLYHNILEKKDIYNPSALYDACAVGLPTACNNSPIGSGFMPQIAPVSLISALIFSVVCSQTVHACTDVHLYCIHTYCCVG